MQIFLIRHPRPRIEPGRCYGRLDVCAEDPQAAALRLKPLLPQGIPIISSPLRRARELADLLAMALDSQLSVDHRLCEIDFGDWEGKAWNDIDRAALDAWAADLLHFTPPGGESVASLQMRVLDFCASLTYPRVALVTHAGVIRALLGHWQNMPVEEWTRLQFDFGSLAEFTI